MRIAIFTNNYLPNPYGVPNSIETFRADFEKLGHEVFIFAPKWKGYADKNPNVFRYPSIDIKIKIRFPLPIPYSWKINKIIKNLDLDIIHAQHPNLLGNAGARWAKKLARRRGGKNIPLVFTWHTLYDQYTNFVPFIPRKFAAGYMIRKAVKFANAADAVVVPTDSITKVLRKWGVTKKITPIPTGIKKSELENADGRPIREKYGVKDEEVLLLVVTRLTSEKNVEFLLRSIIPILQEDRKVKFILAAEGYLREDLEKIVKEEKVEDQVIFAGFVPNDVKKNYYAASDIFVFASKSETQGMVLTEAMYMGLPVVAVNATGANSLVLNNASGFLVKENINEFRNAVEKLINDKDLRQRFGEASQKIARENFTSEICARKMVEVYQRCLNH